MCFLVFLGGSPILAPKVAAAPPERSPAPTPPLGPTPLHLNLHLFRKNVSELRLQLQHMRQLQVIKLQISEHNEKSAVIMYIFATYLFNGCLNVHCYFQDYMKQHS